MNLEATLEEIKKLGVSDRLWLAHAIWESVGDDELPGELSDAQKADLDRRMADMRANPESLLTLDELLARVRGRE